MRDRRRCPNWPFWQPTMIPDGSALCSSCPSGRCPPLHRTRYGFECDSVVHCPSLRQVQLEPVPRQRLEQKGLIAHYPLPRSVRPEPALQWRLEPERSVAHLPSLRSVWVEPALHQQLEQGHLEAHWLWLRWGQLELEVRQQFEQQHSVAVPLRSVPFDRVPQRLPE